MGCSNSCHAWKGVHTCNFSTTLCVHTLLICFRNFPLHSYSLPGKPPIVREIPVTPNFPIQSLHGTSRTMVSSGAFSSTAHSQVRSSWISQSPMTTLHGIQIKINWHTTARLAQISGKATTLSTEVPPAIKLHPSPATACGITLAYRWHSTPSRNIFDWSNARFWLSISDKARAKGITATPSTWYPISWVYIDVRHSNNIK